MRTAGIDIGSRTVKVVVVDENCSILEQRSTDTTFEPLSQCRKLLSGLEYDRIQATGYGRYLFQKENDVPVVSEILAHAAGVNAILPEAKAVLDIGGQDTKAIALNKEGKVRKFEMNDRCAAGTGKFLEVMAKAFGMSIEEFGEFASGGNTPCKISNMCTVFAESEATSLMAKGEPASNIALGLHCSVAGRSSQMVKRITDDVPVAFTGGVAQNPCMQCLVQQEFGGDVLTPEHPHLAGALGAALLLQNQKKAARAHRSLSHNTAG